jgi:hypothetical protein
MNFGARAWATHRQRSATVLLAWGNGALLVSGRRSCTSSGAGTSPRRDNRPALHGKRSLRADKPC